MILVTAANKKFAPFVKKSIDQAEKLGYTYRIYDLGDLGFGIPFPIQDSHFKTHGYYSTIHKTWKTKALHKPDIIMDALSLGEFVVYLDADAVVIDEIDEVIGNYDVGVTIRRSGELENEPLPAHKTIMGQINAGVIFFNPTENTKKFVKEWKILTEKVKNDQLALNQINKSNIKLQKFPAEIYNFYYFPENPDKAKILHYKNNLWEKV